MNKVFAHLLTAPARIHVDGLAFPAGGRDVDIVSVEVTTFTCPDGGVVPTYAVACEASGERHGFAPFYYVPLAA